MTGRTGDVHNDGGCPIHKAGSLKNTSQIEDEINIKL